MFQNCLLGYNITQWKNNLINNYNLNNNITNGLFIVNTKYLFFFYFFCNNYSVLNTLSTPE